MQERLSTAKRVLYTAIVIACVLAVLKILYNTGYSLYMTSEFYNDWKVWEKLSYKMYYSKELKVVGKVLFYSGFVAVYAMWEKPRPNWQFVLLLYVLVLPSIILGTERCFYHDYPSFVFSNTYIAVRILITTIYSIVKWILLGKLYTDAEKESKVIIASYMVVFILGMVLSYMFYIPALTFSRAFADGSYYLRQAVEIALYVITIICLKKKLGDNMPFTNAARFLKKECTNRPRI